LRFVGNMQMGDWFVDYMENGFQSDMSTIDKYKYSLFIIAKYNELNMLQAKYLFTNKKEFNDRLSRVVEDPMFEGLYEKLPVKAKVAWYNFFTHYHALKFEFNKSYEYSNNQLNYIRQHEFTIEKIGLFNYPAILVSHIENNQHLEQYEEGLMYCEQLFSIINLPAYNSMKSLKDQFEIVYIDFKLNCLAFGGRYDECISFYEKMTDRIEELKQIGGINLKLSIHFYLAIAYFGRRDYNASLDHLIRIFDHEKETAFAYQVYPSRVIYIMAHLELGDHEYVSNYLRTFRRYFDKKQAEKKTIDSIVRIFKDYLAISHDKSRLGQQFERWIDLLKELKLDNYEKEFLRNTTIENWIRAKQV